MRLRYEQRASQDISEIYDFISAHDAAAASRVVARIRTLAEQLIENPFLGRKTNHPEIRVRSVARYPYTLYYSILGDQIVVLHIRHTARREPDPSEVI